MSSGGRSASSSSAGRRAADRKSLMGTTPDPAAAAAAAAAYASAPPASASAAHAHAEQLERAVILQEQDVLLDRMSVSMGTLQHISSAITGELEEQATLLEETSLAVEVAHGDMEAVTKRINKLVEKAGGPQWCGVLTCLTSVLILLTFIAFS